MRIPSANIPAPTSNPTPSAVTPAVDKATPRYQTNAAWDSYQKNSGPQIIDAEYVEFYSPSINLFNKERQNLDNTLGPGEDPLVTDGQNNPTDNTPALNKYALKAHNAPPPGSYVDIFA